MLTGDTIAAVSSAPPPAERVVVRLSGPSAIAVAHLHAEVVPAIRGAALTSWNVAPDLAVPATLAVFPAPRSYTGEDVVEIGLPGSPWIISHVMDALLAHPGVRPAEPGEFTARAFLSGKLDLTAAEGVAAAVCAADLRQLRAARQLLAGTLATETRALVSQLANLLALLEAGIDFTEEDISFVSPSDLLDGIAALRAATDAILARGRTFGRFSLIPTVALVGLPNAGKSTLINRLAGKSRAVTSDLAGTTRDLISEDIRLPRGVVRFVDTAGIDAAPAAPETPSVLDDIAASMQIRTAAAAATADLLLRVLPCDDTRAPWPLSRPPDLTVLTKSDLYPPRDPGPDALPVSALTGAGMDGLRSRLDLLCFGESGGEGLALTARHIAHLRDASAALDRAASAAPLGDELAAAALRDALDALGRITGEVSPDDVLGRVFATFCIGK